MARLLAERRGRGPRRGARDAEARAEAPSQVPLDKLAWSVNNEPMPLDRLAHTEMTADSVEVANEVVLMV